MPTSKVHITSLEKGDIFSFRTAASPIWWRFIEIVDDKILYREIKNEYIHQTPVKTWPIVLKKTQLTNLK